MSNILSCYYDAEDHVHKFETLVEYVTEPTCTENGEAVYACSCGERETRIIEASHDYQEVDTVVIKGVVKTSKIATCRENGIQYYQCNVCDDVISEVVYSSEEGHNYIKVDTEEGIEYWQCEYCKDLYTVVINCEHNYELISTTATCTASGIDTYICTKCESKKTERVSAKGHIVPVNDDTTVVAKTCTTNGRAVGKCTVCKKENADMVIPASHEYYVAEETEATCINPGRVSKICTECTDKTPGHKIYEETPATGHTKPVASEVYTYLANPQTTLDEDGNTIYVEDEDGNIQYTRTEELINVAKITTSALNKKLCTQGIVEVYACEDCKDTIEETIYDVKGHNFITRVPAKCKTAGTKVCTVCQTKETIPAIGHKLEGGYVVKNATTDTYRADCQDCGLIDVTLNRSAKTITCDETSQTWNVTITPATANKPESIRIGKIPCTAGSHNLEGAILTDSNSKVTCATCDTELAATSYNADEKTVTIDSKNWNVSISGTTVTIGKEVCATHNYVGAKLTADSKSLTCATCGKVVSDALATNFTTTNKVVEIGGKKYNVVKSGSVYSVGSEHTTHALSGVATIDPTAKTGTATCDCGTVNLTEYTVDTKDATKATVKDDKNVVWNITVGDNEGTPTYTIGSKV